MHEPTLGQIALDVLVTKYYDRINLHTSGYTTCGVYHICRWQGCGIDVHREYTAAGADIVVTNNAVHSMD